MSPLLVSLVLLAAQPPEAAKVQDTALPGMQGFQPLVPPRRGKELEKAAKKALNRWANVDSRTAPAAAKELLVLFRELQQDGALPRHCRRQLHQRVRNRLRHLAEVIQKATGEDRWAEAPANLDAAGMANVLGQRGRDWRQPGFGAGRQPGGFGGTGSFGHAVPDAGEDLVELIHRTIAPPHWDVNGGTGSIYYWRPGRALVIRARQDVHEQVGNLLDQLRRAGP